MTLLTTILKRPIQNIKTIDFGAVAWVLFWMGGLMLLIIPVQHYGDINNALSLIFSFDFLEKIEVTQSESIFEPDFNSARINSLNQLYTAFNVAKVAWWVVTLGFIFRFLFKKPTLKSNI